MHLILSHSQTDFDGLAAQLGAARLFPDALPLLNPHLNQNVRNFLALAQEELPFVRVADLPEQPISRLTLVDTDLVPRIIPLPSEPIPTLIIDHHELTRPPGEHEQRIAGETGSTVALIIDQLIQAGIQLKPLEATLLLLGIYEDTGNLTLPTTRAADLRGAAWLLDQGARLSAVDEFLSRMLSPAQRQIEQELEQNLKIETLQGWVVLQASATVEGSVPELAPLAHRLREQYRAAITILAIGTSDAGTQLILRSTPEALDARSVVIPLGGGGHAAAAAAFVRGQTPDQVMPIVAAALHANLRPAAAAADLMTTRVHTLDLDATVGQAALLQAKSGHSALPVIDANRVVRGLVGRRELDRAMRHGLQSAPIARYMWKGPKLVRPTTTLAELRQALLDDEGRITGRLLVVDEQRRLLGIITRADLLRAWEGPASSEREGHADLAAALSRFLPGETIALLRQIAQLAEHQGDTLYLVGGSVRDLLVERPPLDLDLVVEGDAIRLAEAYQQQFGGTVHSHLPFRTATLELPDRTIDLVTARTEFYEQPAMLPEVDAASLRFDLHRRDFTINTLAICLNPTHYGRLYDFYGGRRDIERRIIRVLHNLSFLDDPTRILRAARLAARLNCTIEPRTEALITDAIEQRMLSRTSPQRILTELQLTFQEPQPAAVLQLLQQWGALASIHPALEWSDHLSTMLHAAEPAEINLSFGLALLLWPCTPEQRLQITGFLRLSNHQQQIIGDLNQITNMAEDLQQPLRDSQIDAMLRGIDPLALRIAALGSTERMAMQIERYRTILRAIRLEISGDDLRALGLTPGPRFRHILDTLRAALLDGHATTREALLDLARHL
jgi:tRNA nucleotidyltransferase (CCA-adding enzyme)